MTKISVQVENYLQNRFPVTAPNGVSRDKKLFKAMRHNNRSGTPKYLKKDQLLKKPLKGNIALISALSQNYKSSGHPKSKYSSKNLMSGKSNNYFTKERNKYQKNYPKSTKHSSSKKIDLNFGNSSKNYGQRINSSQVMNRKKKEYNKDQDSVVNYIKNNFFLKGNYNLSNSRDGNKSNKSHSRNKQKNQTHEGINKNRMSSLQKKSKKNPASSYQEEKKKPRFYIDESILRKMNFENLLKIETILNKICSTVKKDFEIYDHIKEYVDIVQEEEFDEFYNRIKQSNPKIIFKNSLILERWAMFFIFFFYFNEKMMKENGKIIRKLAEVLHQNLIVMLTFWYECCAKFGIKRRNVDMLERVLKKRSQENKTQEVSLGYDDFYPLVQNNSIILSVFNKW